MLRTRCPDLTLEEIADVFRSSCRGPLADRIVENDGWGRVLFGDGPALNMHSDAVASLAFDVERWMIMDGTADLLVECFGEALPHLTEEDFRAVFSAASLSLQRLSDALREWGAERSDDVDERCGRRTPCRRQSR